MRVLVNALSTTSLSGRHVLYGHLRQLASAGADDHELVVLAQPDEPRPEGLRRPNVQWLLAPALCHNWIARSVWEGRELPRLMRRRGIDLYFTPSGTVLPSCEVPQVSLAQNPWCLVPGLHRGVKERLKARLQRRAYRNAYRHAALMVYNSGHMRELYRRNAPGSVERAGIVAHQAIDDVTHERAAAMRQAARPQPGTILSVSVMAHWKGAEVLVRALKVLHRRGIPARLRLVGPWPDPAYARLVRREIDIQRLGEFVDITGEVPLDQLHRFYAEARVFCLMSRCESFGIPAVEAQAFGAPVVGANTNAMPEICGAGGVYGPPQNPEAAADLLGPLLTDETRWQELSDAAAANAARFRWSACSRPLAAMFDLDRLNAAPRIAGVATGAC